MPQVIVMGPYCKGSTLEEELNKVLNKFDYYDLDIRYTVNTIDSGVTYFTALVIIKDVR